MEVEFSIIPPVLWGLLAGAIFSIALGIHSKRTATELTHTLFGMTSMTLLKYIIVILITFTVVIVSTFSVMIQDLKYPNENPIAFTAETFAVSFLPSLIIFMMVAMRGKPITRTVFMEYILLSLKFGIAHILLQFSGIYTSVFEL
jgi:hypothetical protein